MNAQILIPPKSNIKSIIVVSNLINDTLLNHRNIPIMDFVVYILGKMEGVLRYFVSLLIFIVKIIQKTLEKGEETAKKLPILWGLAFIPSQKTSYKYR